MFCKHNFELLYEKEIPSIYDNMKAVGASTQTGRIMMFSRTYLIVFKCTKCGKLHTIKEATI